MARDALSRRCDTLGIGRTGALGRWSGMLGRRGSSVGARKEQRTRQRKNGCALERKERGCSRAEGAA
jgi:hypothetical protein